MTNEVKKKCTYCDRSLVPIGSSRINGKHHNDWSTRPMHKKCFVECMNKYGFISEEFKKNLKK
jgi:hypothetical protein